ncbi:MAG: DNRLRE domain-containing protein [Pirellulaceae bacterium]|nr:DNRLRE domain-containing protein [Pirellulaceae bacterium]
MNYTPQFFLNRIIALRNGRIEHFLTIVAATIVVATYLSSSLHAQERFAIIGDFGNLSSTATNVATRLSTMKPTWIATTGDNIYTTGGTTAEFDNAIGNLYGAYIKGSASATGTATINNFYPSAGNHDVDTAGGSLLQNYRNYFDLTNSNDSAISSSSGNERFYDFVRGDVHTFVLSSDTRDSSALGGGQAIGSPQRTWFNNALAASTSTWNVVTFHHPSYSTEATSGDHSSNPYMQWGFSSGSNTAQVIYNGHAHSYERTVTPATGQQYVLEGSGGQSTRGFDAPVLSGTAQTVFRDTTDPSVVTAEGGRSYNGFSIAEANSTHYTQKHFQANGKLLDHFTLVSPGNVLASTSFSKGNSNGYMFAQDTQLSQSAPGVSFGSATTITVDSLDAGGQATQVLLRFDQLFGLSAGQIPMNAEIASATLNIDVTNAGSGLSVYQMLADWQDTSTWSSLVDGVSSDGIEAALAGNYDVTVGTGNSGGSSATNVGVGAFSLDVTKSLRAWANGDVNRGWLLNFLASGTNGVGFSSSDSTAAAFRPRLDVEYISAVPEPSSAILAGIALSTILVRRGRRLCVSLEHA